MKSIRLLSASTNKRLPRGGAPEGVAEISWAVRDDEDAAMACGFGHCDGVTEPKTITYDEIILVLEGSLAVEANGSRVEGRSGDVIEVPKGNTVTYQGCQSKLFFVTRQ